MPRTLSSKLKHTFEMSSIATVSPPALVKDMSAFIIPRTSPLPLGRINSFCPTRLFLASAKKNVALTGPSSQQWSVRNRLNALCGQALYLGLSAGIHGPSRPSHASQLCTIARDFCRQFRWLKNDRF